MILECLEIYSKFLSLRVVRVRKFKEIPYINGSEKRCRTVNIKEQEDNHEDPKIPTATKIVEMRGAVEKKYDSSKVIMIGSTTKLSNPAAKYERVLPDIHLPDTDNMLEIILKGTYHVLVKIKLGVSPAVCLQQ